MKIGKNIVFIFAAILLVGGSFVFAEYRNNQAENIYVAPEIVSSFDKSAQDVDTDSDGVKDWEEILLGTDPEDPKSREVKASSSGVVKDLTKTVEKLEPIDLVSREFFARYMELRQIGLSADQVSQQELVERTLGGIVLTQPKSYAEGEISISKDAGSESIKKYGNDVALIFKNNSLQSRNEGAIAKDAQEKENPEILRELDPIIANYTSILNFLLKISVPQSMAILHLDLVNSINGALFVAQSFRNSASDPVQGLQAVGQYQIIEKNLFDAIKALKSYFLYLGIEYDAIEPGFLLFTY